MTPPSAAGKPVAKVIFACDAGMGSSALGATRFRKRLADAGIGIMVGNSAADSIPADADVVVCQSILAGRIAGTTRDAELVVIDNFLTDPNLDALFARLGQTARPADSGSAEAGAPCEDAVVPEGSRDSTTPESVGCEPAPGNTEDTPDAILRPANILVCLRSEPKEAAIRRAGELLVAGGYAAPEYVDAMLRREELATTCMGSGIAIPHGTSDAKGRVLRSGIVVLQYPDGVAFGDETVHLVVGIAGVGDAHLDILARLAAAFGDEEVLRRLTTCTDPRAIYEALK